MLRDIVNTGLGAHAAATPKSSDDREFSSECSEISLPRLSITKDM